MLAAFTPGNVLVYRAGNGTLGTTAVPVFIDEFNPNDLGGAPVQSIALPTTTVGLQRALTGGGSAATTEGLITRSADGRYLLLTGYDAAVGTSIGTANRVVGRIDADGNVDTSTHVSTIFSTIRGVASTDGTDIWMTGSGASGGVRHTTFGTAGSSTLISNLTANLRALGILGGQLYVSSSDSFKLGKVGTGTPTTGGQTIANLPGIPAGTFPADPYQFFFADLSPTVPGVDTLYVADQGTTPALRKFSLSAGGTWSQTGNVARAVRGLAGVVNGTTVTLYATTSVANGNELLRITDTGGYDAPFTAVQQPIYSGPMGQVMRGVALVPVASVDPNPTIAGSSDGDLFEITRSSGNLIVRRNGLSVLNQPLAETESLTIDAGDGDDRVIVDYGVGGYFDVPLTLIGGPNGAGGDSLLIRGSLFAAVKHQFSGTAAGNLDLDADGLPEIGYSELETSRLDSSMANLVLDIVPPGTIDGTIGDYSGPGDAGHSELRFAVELASFQFSPPSDSLTVRTHGSSQVEIEAFDGAFGPPSLVFEDLSGIASDFVLQASERVPNGTSLTIAGDARFDLNGSTETIAGLFGTGIVENTAAGQAELVVGNGNATSELSGEIQNSGGSLSLTKVGSGTLTLSGTSTNDGLTKVLEGTLHIDGSITGDVTVENDGTLGGSGNIGGSVAVGIGGTISGGGIGSLGTLTIEGNLSFDGGAYLADLIASASDMLIVGGLADLMSPAQGLFSLVHSGVVPLGLVFKLIDHTAAGAIADPPFAGAPEGGSAFVGNNGVRGRFSYSGGTGNDFTLTIASSDNTCDGIDDDADGATDEDFVPIVTATTSVICVGGALNSTPLADWGDAPTTSQSGLDASYPTLAADNGAGHTAVGPRLGALRDVETDGQPALAATGDDAAGGPDDEDGVTFQTPLATGNFASLEIDVQNAGPTNRLDAWIDFNQDGVWDDSPGSIERVFTAQVLAAGSNVLAASIPAGAAIGPTFARFRLSTLGGLTPAGVATDGEVEDYRVNITAPLAATTSVEFVGEDLVITDIDGADSDDQLTLSRNGDYLRIHDPIHVLGAGAGTTQVDAHTVDILLADISGGVIVNTLGGNDSLTILETAGGLPVFADPATGPAGSHASQTFTDLTGYGQPGAPIDLHFDGGASDNSLSIQLLNSHAVVYTSDQTGANAGGNVGIGSGGNFPLFGARQFGISFINLSPLTLIGVGGTLTADASDSPANDVTSLTIADDGASADGVSTLVPNPGSLTFRPVSFSGFTGLVVRSGSGRDTIDLVSLDSATVLTEIALDADSLSNTDVSNDVLRVQSTGGAPATVHLLGGWGHDSFELQQVAGPMSIDSIAGQVVVSPTAGPLLDDPAAGDIDSLTISDAGDTDGDAAAITESSLHGLTNYSTPGPAIVFHHIDRLDVTGTAGANTFDIALNPGSDLDDVVVRGVDGNDVFLLDLNTGDDVTNIVPGLSSVTLLGDAGGDTFGETPTEAPHQGTGLPSLPLPPTPLPSPTFPLGKGKIRPSRSTRIVLVGGGSDHPSAAASPAGNSTVGNVFGADFDLVNLDLTDNRHPTNTAPPGDSQDSYAVVSTVGGTATLSDNDPGESFQPIAFRSFEALNLCDQGHLVDLALGDLYVRLTEGNDILQVSRGTAPNIFRTRINSQFVNLAATGRIVAYGRGGNDNFQMTTATLANNAPLHAVFYGEAGDDYLAGYTGDDLLVGGAGRDRLLGGNGRNELWGDNIGEETLLDGIDQLTGGIDNDLAYGCGGNDTIYLGGGDDYAYGGSGNDQIDGQAGNDRLYGGDGDDVVSGSDGVDLIAGNGGRDRLYGRAGHDVVIGGDGADTISGDDGNDLLFDGSVSYNDPLNVLASGDDGSTANADGSDLAMAALLNDWALDHAISAALLAVAHDEHLDYLYGGAGNDRAYRRATGTGKDSTSDLEVALP